MHSLEGESTGKALWRKVRIVFFMYMVWRSMEGECKSETLRWRWLECMEVMQRRGRLRKQWIFNTPREKDWWTGRMSGDRSSCHVSTWACHSEPPPWETAGSCDVTTPDANPVLFRLTFSVVSGCPQWNHFSGEMIVWNAVCFCGIREMMHTWVMTGRSKTIKASGRHVTGNDDNSNGSLVKVLTMDATSARVRGEIKIKSVWTNGYQNYNTMKCSNRFMRMAYRLSQSKKLKLGVNPV